MTSAANWRVERDGEDIVWLWADRQGSSANVLGSAELTELDGHLERIRASHPRGVVVLSAKKSGFIAGADIKEFTALNGAESGYRLIHAGQQVLDRLESLPCPTVAALHGFALGGGLELALACRYRVAVGDERLSLGLPEVQLGIHPGFGGTVRSVRLIGVRAAMEMMLTGKPVRAEKALRLGLVDRLVGESELKAAARSILLETPGPHRPPLGERIASWPLVRSLVQHSITAQSIENEPPRGVARHQPIQHDGRPLQHLISSSQFRRGAARSRRVRVASWVHFDPLPHTEFIKHYHILLTTIK